MRMRWESFLDAVRERGEYPSPHEAERAARVVLALLGAHLVGEVRTELAARLPETFELILLNPSRPPSPSPRAVHPRHRGMDRGEPPRRPPSGTPAPC